MKRALRAVLLAAILPLLAGCLATRRDVQDVRTQLDAVRVTQTQQTDALREIQRQAQLMLDSLSSQNFRARGDLANRMLQLERQLVQIQELTGQGQQQLTQLRQQINARTREAVDTVPPRDSGSAAPASPGNVDELYDSALAAYRRGSMATARAGFEALLRTAPQHRSAAEAQFYIGETYVQGKDAVRALDAFGRVVELYPNSPRAAAAVFRIGQVEMGRGNRTEARAAFNRVIRAYPRSPEATQARAELARTATQ